MNGEPDTLLRRAGGFLCELSFPFFSGSKMESIYPPTERLAVKTKHLSSPKLTPFHLQSGRRPVPDASSHAKPQLHATSFAASERGQQDGAPGIGDGSAKGVDAGNPRRDTREVFYGNARQDFRSLRWLVTLSAGFTQGI